MSEARVLVGNWSDSRMRILIAEDEEDIALSYKEVLESRRHEVTLTKNGRLCLDEYRLRSCNIESHPFDVVLLDYRMPVMNGFETAQEILRISQNQRIIFASAYSRETLENLIKNDGMIVELLQKPFGRQELVNAIEDTLVYSKLQRLKVDIGDIKMWNPTHEQLSDLLDALLRLKDPNYVFGRITSGRNSSCNTTLDYSSTLESSKLGHDDRILALVDDAMKFLGSDSISVFYFHLAKMGVQRHAIAQNPEQFVEALESMFGNASQMVIMRILKRIEEKNSSESLTVNFAKSLKRIKAVPKTSEGRRLNDNSK